MKTNINPVNTNQGSASSPWRRAGVVLDQRGTLESFSKRFWWSFAPDLVRDESLTPYKLFLSPVLRLSKGEVRSSREWGIGMGN